MQLTVSKGHDAVVIVCSADAGYVLPLTVMLASVRAHLPARRHLDIHIIDEDIPEPEKAHLRRSLDLDAVTISWHTADRSRLVGVPLWGRLPVCVYNKLLVPDVLPEEVHTALWLDSDTLVLGDISPLWDEGTGQHGARCPGFGGTAGLVGYGCRAVPRVGASTRRKILQLRRDVDEPTAMAGTACQRSRARVLENIRP